MLVILNKVVGKKRIANVEIPFRGVPNPDLTTFWKHMQSFLDGTEGRSIILGLHGYHDHWTVIEKIRTDPSCFTIRRASNDSRVCLAQPSTPPTRGNTSCFPRKRISSQTTLNISGNMPRSPFCSQDEGGRKLP